MKDTSKLNVKETLDIHEIMNILPHRYPFLMIDRVLELVPGETIVAMKSVTFNEPFFCGHFPGNPIMPGVFIIEGMAQAGGVLALASLPQEMHGTPVYFMGINKVKFRRPVIPGDQLVFHVKFLKKSSWAVKFAGVAIVDEERVCEAELTATFAKRTGSIPLPVMGPNG